MADCSPSNGDVEFAVLISQIQWAATELNAAAVELALVQRGDGQRFPEAAALINLAKLRLTLINDHVDRLSAGAAGAAGGTP